MSAINMLKATYKKILNIEDYVNDLIKPRTISLKMQTVNDEVHPRLFYVARTPIFSEKAEQDLIYERNKLNKASLTKNSSQKELVQYAISILCNKYLKLSTVVKRNNTIANRHHHHSNTQGNSSDNTNTNTNTTKNKNNNNYNNGQTVNFHNVLSLGYGAPTGYNVSNNSNVVDAHAIVNFYPNTLVNILQTSGWKNVLNEIGDELMLHMLLNCSIFKSLKNGCFMQITGPPLSSIANELQKRKKMSSKIKYIPRMSIFYSQTFPSTPGLSKYHFAGIPNLDGHYDTKFLVASLTSKRKAIKIIFKHLLRSRFDNSNTNHKNTGKRIQRLPKSYLKLIKPMQQILENHTKCEYCRLINKHCPLIYEDDEEQTVRKSIDAMTTDELDLKLGILTKMNTPTKNVIKYIWSVLHTLLSFSFFGSKYNENTFRSNLAYFLQCGRHDVVRLERLTMSIKPTHMPWLYKPKDEKYSAKEPPSANKTRMTIVSQFVDFIYAEIVIPILRHDFYITEIESSFNKVGYYRRSIWTKIQSIAIEKLKRQKILRLEGLNLNKIRNNLTRRNDHNDTKVILRFVPKKRTVRPIMNMSRKNKRSKTNTGASNTRGLSKNQLLKNTYKALKYETERDPSLLGATVYGHDDIYKKLKPFLLEHKHQKLYFVALDIMTCYDSITQRKCFGIVKHVLKETEYVFQRYSVMHPEPADQSTRVAFLQEANTLGNEKQFLDLSTELSNSKRSAVFTDSVVYRNEEREKLIEILEDHLFKNLVTVGPGQNYLQTNGIPQGSILSTLMCNLYYGKMEKMKFPAVFQNSGRHLGNFNNNGVVSNTSSTSLSPTTPARNSVMVRLVDDYLLVTRDKDVATNFVRTMHHGIPEFSCSVKSCKTKINFDCDLKANDFNRIEEGGDLAWCGLLINTDSGEITGDYSKYQNVKMQHVVTNVYTGVELSKKTRAFLKPKCHALLFDSDLNGMDIVRINAFHMYLIAAIKFHTLVKRLPQQPNSNPAFFLHVINDACKYGKWLIYDRCKKFNTKSSMREDEIVFIGLYAFFYVLKRKQCRYMGVIDKLKQRVFFYQRRCVSDADIEFERVDEILKCEKNSEFIHKINW
jgi:hypothetical protein